MENILYLRQGVKLSLERRGCLRLYDSLGIFLDPVENSSVTVDGRLLLSFECDVEGVVFQGLTLHTQGRLGRTCADVR